MTSLVLTITETLRYRGALGQWSWVLHRISGLGVVLFLTLHVIDTSWSVFYPELYVRAIAAYQTPLFTIGEFALVAAVVYHAFNGLRIVILDFRPALWRYQARAAWIVLLASVITLIPVFVLMFGHVLNFYNDPEHRVLPLSEVLQEQLPFAAGIVIALVAGILYSGIHGVLSPAKPIDARQRPIGSGWEKFWWSYMRISGIIIVPLVFGHLGLMHVLQGVFDITAQGSSVVGTNVINQSGTAVEFVADRWNLLISGIAVWRLYDIALLALAVIHGFNGLRYVLTDYSSGSTLVRRGMVYACIIGALILLVVGALALLGTIDQTAIKMAQEAVTKIQ